METQGSDLYCNEKIGKEQLPFYLFLGIYMMLEKPKIYFPS